MKLLTKEIEKKLNKYPFNSQDGKLGEAEVIVKFFNPVGVGTWFITEAEKQDSGKYLFYGYCHLGDDDMAEMGYVSEEELESIRLPYGLKIERDMYIKSNTKLANAIKSSGFKVPSYLIKDNYER